MLPLLLVLLIVLFDTVAHGVLVLFGLVADWLRRLVPGGGGLPPYRSAATEPLRVALHSLLLSLPCAGGLAVAALHGTRRRWWFVLVAWSMVAAAGGKAVALVLMPGLLSALLLATARPPAPI